MASWTDAAAMVRRSENAESSRARQVGPAQAVREAADNGQGDYPAPVPYLTKCATCEEPIALVNVDRHGREVCGSCLDVGEAICGYVHAERLAVIRARAVLAREGIAGYGEGGR